MKNTYIYILVFFALLPLLGVAQYKQTVLQEVSFDQYGDPISSSNGETFVEDPFDFKITFTNMNVLLNMQNAMAAYNKAKVDEWMRKQEDNFKNEINRQLGTKHNVFKDAQKDFYKNFEKNFNRIEERGRDVSSSHFLYSGRLDNEQKTFTNDLTLIKDWKASRNNCKPLGIIDCGNEGKKIVRGVRLESASLSTLDRLENESLVDFANREYTSAQNKSWGQGVDKIINDGSILLEMTNNHIAYYSSRDLKSKIFLMTAYLTQYNNRNLGPMSVPISSYKLPILWENQTLLDKGKKVAPLPDIKALIFEPNYILNKYTSCQAARPRGPKGVLLGPDLCTPQRLQYENLKKQVVLEHQDKLINYDEFGMTSKLEKIRDGIVWANGSGKIGGLNSLAYSNYILDGTSSAANRFYKLTNGGWVYRSSTPRSVNGGIPNSDSSLNYDDFYYYIFNDETNNWHELLLPATGVSVNSDPYLVTAFWNVMAGIARYATPLEDAIILIDGRDFYNAQASQKEAGVFLVIGFVPDGKLLKPVLKSGGKAVKIIMKIGGKTIIQNATAIEGFITVLTRVSLPPGITSSFIEGGYRTVKNSVDLNVYRSFGKPNGINSAYATIDGAFATTSKGVSRNELAIIKDFNNSMRFEAVIKVPSGNTLNIGKIAAQTSKDGLEKLAGGGDQVLLPSNWNLNWITEILDTETGKKYTLTEFRKLFPELFKR